MSLSHRQIQLLLLLLSIKLIERYNNGINPQWCANVNCMVWVLSLRNVHGHQEQVASKCQQGSIHTMIPKVILVFIPGM